MVSQLSHVCALIDDGTPGPVYRYVVPKPPESMLTGSSSIGEADLPATRCVTSLSYHCEIAALWGNCFHTKSPAVSTTHAATPMMKSCKEMGDKREAAN